MVTTEPNFVDPDYDEYAAFESRSLFCCRYVAAIVINLSLSLSGCVSACFMVLLILRHTLPILVNGAQDYSFPLFLLLLLRTTGIIVPINIMVKAVNAIKCCQRQWTRNATGLVAPAIAASLGALTHTLGILVPVIEASGFATATTATAIGTVVSSFR